MHKRKIPTHFVTAAKAVRPDLNPDEVWDVFPESHSTGYIRLTSWQAFVQTRPKAEQKPKQPEQPLISEQAQPQPIESSQNTPKDGRQWAYSLKARHERGESLNRFQVGAYRAALKLTVTK